MIFVDRNQPMGGVIVRPNLQWFKDAETLTVQAKQEGKAHQVTDLYKHVEVKKALEKLFNSKCAYCEGPITQAPWDVEHYRPKGRVKENRDHAGYYWLAYTWENLLPSCTFCNQNRKDQPTWENPVAGPAAGKVDQFPLDDEHARAMGPESPLAAEVPLLLNPCVDQDCETYFRYDIQGHILPAKSDAPRRRALRRQRELKRKRAEETIRLCHLTRRRLRRDRFHLMQKVIKAAQIHEVALSQNNAALAQHARELLDLFIADDSPFAGAARFVDRNRQIFIAAPL